MSIYHIELAGHDVLIADGAPAESYRDDGNRWLFQNRQSGLGAASEAALRAGADRRFVGRCGVAAIAGTSRTAKGLPLTDEPDLHLLVGRRTGGCDRASRGHVCVPSDHQAALCAAHFSGGRPTELGLARDPRVLGVALRQLVLVQARRQQVIEADASTLADGFYPFEPEDGIRWTDGDATIPAELFSGMVGRGMLILHLGAATKYADEGCVRQIA